MGQKVNPIGLRLGIVKTWESRWYARGKQYADLLHEDIEIRKEIKKRFYHAGIARVDIERAGDRAKITIHTARPGIIIGRKGQEIEAFRKSLETRTGKKIAINIEEIKKPDLSAQLVAENIASQLLRRIGFRRAMKKTVLASVKAGALGIKIQCGGRLAGAEIARTEWYREGRVPLHTLRADIDYGFAEARTKYGVIGIKVWIFLGEILEEKKAPKQAVEQPAVV
ncbi:MAG: 30S ribosomal protein S3 [Candidatus Hydrogenedentota bacterium]|uniref:Small ribosomal subunit protein uS3 n=1 Tax=Sumerlaea chitinivorans TaxID=2250252 RepID=A0A2Z4Y2I5_SUMC1|nr:SSU ribosomal protein S3p (S3e) [Candidatus Sumerlaea chitinivorans]MCX7963630.1 30S ribosomal protein S3 [Candidatus Sumerlaea chitinivorans]RMH25885.1 MAG: 30S ribosomal protein S3 [Candidatus Hydrogenedentota bacterium]GIX45326.1 MAG: 30S ribosomal protein S3 [Candidatus Sumerlaea sp.]